MKKEAHTCNIKNFTILCCVNASLCLLSSQGQAQEVTPENPCVTQETINSLAQKFHHKIHYELAAIKPKKIVAISNPVLVKYDSASATQGFQRWYCKADSHLDDKNIYPIYYMVEKSQPFTALQTTNVEFCMESFDPGRVYNGFCRSLRAHNLGVKNYIKKISYKKGY